MNHIGEQQHQRKTDPTAENGVSAPVGPDDVALFPKRTHPAGQRPSKPDVRNPVLALPSVARLRALSPEARHALQEILLDIQSDARVRAEKSWRSHKPPIAAYWAACGVYAGHITRSIGPRPGRRSSTRRPATHKETVEC